MKKLCIFLTMIFAFSMQAMDEPAQIEYLKDRLILEWPLEEHQATEIATATIKKVNYAVSTLYDNQLIESIDYGLRAGKKTQDLELAKKMQALNLVHEKNGFTARKKKPGIKLAKEKAPINHAIEVFRNQVWEKSLQFRSQNIRASILCKASNSSAQSSEYKGMQEPSSKRCKQETT